MSHYWVGKLCFDASRNPALIEEYKSDPEAVLNRYHFTDEERKKLQEQDAAFFYQLGINPYLVGRIGPFMQLERPGMTKSLRTAGPHPLLSDIVAFPGPAKDGKYLIRNEDL